MTISLKDINEGDVIDIDKPELFNVHESYGLTESAVLCNVRATITKRGNGFDLEGSIAARLSLRCARCLCDINAPLEASLSERLKEGADDEVLRVENDEIDLAPVLIAVLLLNIPMKTLCKDDCKGLCGKCGFNLNEGAHDCGGKEIDPRFAALKPLIQKEV